MKVLLDTNVLISYLLATETERTITTVVRACLLDPIIKLLVPSELLIELTQTINNREYLHNRILPTDAEELANQLILVGERTESLVPESSFSRDPNDDYLIAHGLVGNADYLITGDPDLLVLEQVKQLQIVKPIQFLEIIRKQGIL